MKIKCIYSENTNAGNTAVQSYVLDIKNDCQTFWLHQQFCLYLRHTRLGYNSIVTWLQARQTGIQIPVEEDCLISQHIQTGSGTHPGFFQGHLGSFLVAKWPESVDHLPPPNAELHTEWRYISTPSPFMACMDQLYLYPRNASEEHFSL